MIEIFLILAVILVWLSFKSLRGGFTYLHFFKRELAKPVPTWTPFVTVIAPCRGVDEGMEGNLASLLQQEFPNYEIVFVVDDAADLAVEVIEHARMSSGSDQVLTKLMTAAKAVVSAQKVENLREAVLHADKRSEVFVFVDSDTRVSPVWLRYLVAPLEDTGVGATTGYRWFISEKPTFASEMRSVWNSSVASALGPNTKSNFCWGGSMAMRRDIFERIGMREKWLGTLSDDFAVTRTMQAAGLPIVHVPQALTATVENCTFRELLEFTTRQMKITRVYATPLWVMTLIGTLLFNGVLLASLLMLVLAVSDVAFWSAVGTLVWVSAFSIGKAWLRLDAVRLALPQYRRELKRQFWTQNTLWALSPLLFLYNSIAALLSRRMTWRGTTYELKSPTETVIIASR
jgi:cellulose synthase/poly-beta-1,6-N-acetylglucosamine synthase-like glycosyltransferase